MNYVDTIYLKTSAVVVGSIPCSFLKRLAVERKKAFRIVQHSSGDTKNPEIAKALRNALIVSVIFRPGKKNTLAAEKVAELAKKQKAIAVGVILCNKKSSIDIENFCFNLNMEGRTFFDSFFVCNNARHANDFVYYLCRLLNEPSLRYFDFRDLKEILESNGSCGLICHATVKGIDRITDALKQLTETNPKIIGAKKMYLFAIGGPDLTLAHMIRMEEFFKKRMANLSKFMWDAKIKKWMKNKIDILVAYI